MLYNLCAAKMKGDIHEYLGLTINFSENGQVIFTMYDYIEDIIGTPPSDMNGTAPDPTRVGMFTIDIMPPLLDADGAEFFHSMTDKLLFTAKQKDLISKLLFHICAPESKNQQKTTMRI